MKTISERLRRGKLAYTAKASTVYEGPTLQDTEAADTIDTLVSALEAIWYGYGLSHMSEFARDTAKAALTQIRGWK